MQQGGLWPAARKTRCVEGLKPALQAVFDYGRNLRPAGLVQGREPLPRYRLSSGIDISGTISKLMAIASQPVTALTTTDTTLTNQETAVSQLSALLLSVQDVTQTLGQAVDLRQPDRHQQRHRRRCRPP